MRVVIYDDEDMEPITVINLRGVTARDLRERGMLWRVPVPEPTPMRVMPPEEEFSLQKMRVVDLEFERFRRRTRDGREQESLICFTKAADLAMLLNPEWLPGQRSAVNYLQDQNDRLTDMLLSVIMR